MDKAAVLASRLLGVVLAWGLVFSVIAEIWIGITQEVTIRCVAVSIAVASLVCLIGMSNSAD